MSTTPILSLDEVAEAQAQKATQVALMFRELESRTVRVLSRTTGTPPAEPGDGDAYIVPEGASGIWAAKVGQVAAYLNGTWYYYAPVEGIGLWVSDDDEQVVYDGAAWAVLVAGTGGGTAWGNISGTLGDQTDLQSALDAKAASDHDHDATYAPIAQPYDVGCSYNGAPTESLVLLRYPFPRQVVFPSGLTGSRGVAATAPTAQTDFDIQKNGSSVGTMRFAAEATTATFISAGGASFAAGDILSVVAPETPDATLAGIGFSLAGTR